MATAFDQAYYGWSHEDGNDSQDIPVSQMLDHGSISFGRYAVESLSWEKRSVFTHNKCQEELEKFRNPGIVAQKKAYFEEYYKRIRALKALQNQQTELTLDYGGDGSFSSQNGEEEEIVGQPKGFGNGLGNSNNILAEGNKAQATMEKDNISSDASQIGHLDMESTISAEDLSARNLINVGQEMNASNTVPMHPVDVDSSANKSMLRSIELTVQHDIIDLEDDGISRKYENSVADGELERAAQGATGPNVAPEIELQKTSSYHTSHKPRESKKPDSNLVENISTVKQHVDLVSASRHKGQVFGHLICPQKFARNELKLENKTKSDEVKPSHGIKHSPRKVSSKAERGIVSSMATSSRISSDKKSTSAASYRSLVEVHPNVTIPRPFSLATERRAAASFGNKDAAEILDSKVPNRLASSLSRARGAMEVQGSSRKTATFSSATSTGQHKRCQGVKDKHLASGNQGSKGRGAHVLGPKSRSVNLPGNEKSNPSGRIGLTAAIGRNKQKEIKEDSSSNDAHRAGTKNNAPPNGFLNTGNRQASIALKNNSTLDTKKQQIGSLSCDGRKPRQDMPRWR